MHDPSRYHQYVNRIAPLAVTGRDWNLLKLARHAHFVSHILETLVSCLRGGVQLFVRKEGTWAHSFCTCKIVWTFSAIGMLYLFYLFVLLMHFLTPLSFIGRGDWNVWHPHVRPEYFNFFPISFILVLACNHFRTEHHIHSVLLCQPTYMLYVILTTE